MNTTRNELNQPGLGTAHQHPARNKQRINALSCKFDCGGLIDSILVSHPIDVMVWPHCRCSNEHAMHFPYIIW